MVSAVDQWVRGTSCRTTRTCSGRVSTERRTAACTSCSSVRSCRGERPAPIVTAMCGTAAQLRIVNGSATGSSAVLIHTLFRRVYSLTDSVPCSMPTPLLLKPWRGDIGDMAR